MCEINNQENSNFSKHWKNPFSFQENISKNIEFSLAWACLKCWCAYEECECD